MLGAANPFKRCRSARSRPTAAVRTRCCRTTCSSRSTRRCSTSGYVGFTIPFAFAVAALDHGPLRRRLARRRAPHDARRVGLPHRRHRARRVVELRGARAGAATGAGTRSRTRRCCRGSPRTAFIHSVMVQERRGMLRVWNLSLVLATFCLTILGTFLTRSGVVKSVHASRSRRIGPWLLDVPRRRRDPVRRADRLAGRRAALARAASTRRCRAKPRSC